MPANQKTYAGYFSAWLSPTQIYEKSYTEKLHAILGWIYSDENLKHKFNEADHPRDEDGKFTEKDKPRNQNHVAEQIQKSLLEKLRNAIPAGNENQTGGESGADTGALRDKNNDEQTRFSEEYYNAIRNRKSKSDIDAIAKNTSFSTIQITNIRNHIFEEIHDLGDGRIERFDTDWRIAQAWQRLEQGKYNELDILMLNHELYELTLMREKGYNYEEAHIEAHKKYPWGTLIKDEK